MTDILFVVFLVLVIYGLLFLGAIFVGHCIDVMGGDDDQA